MKVLVSRLLAVGVDIDDDDDARLRKLLLLVAALSITPLAIAWGAIFWIAGDLASAVIPWLYVAISLSSLAVFARTRSYRWFAIGQFVPYISLPFVLMWSLGGFVPGSAAAVWAALAPITALLLGHRRAGALLVAAYGGLMVVSAIVPTRDAPPMSEGLRQALFVLNLTMVPLLAWLLVRLFEGGREGSLVAIRRLVSRYLPPDLVTALVADPERSELGGQIADVSVLFADLGSYTTFAETSTPGEVVRMLNRYFAITIPIIIGEGGTPTQLPGDAVMAVFGAPTPQPDHALRACRAAIAIIERTGALARGESAGPRFHIGINSGAALVGNIGSEEFRNFTAIGDTTNLAARFQNLATPGQVVIGATTARLVEDSLDLAPMGSVGVKGRVEPVEIFVLIGDRGDGRAEQSVNPLTAAK